MVRLLFGVFYLHVCLSCLCLGLPGSLNYVSLGVDNGIRKQEYFGVVAMSVRHLALLTRISPIRTI